MQTHEPRAGRAPVTTLRRFFTYLRPYRPQLGLALLSLIVMAALDALRPIMIMLVVDHVIVDQNLGLLAPLIGGIVGIGLAHGAATYGQTYLRRWIGEKVVYDLRSQLYGHLHYLDSSFHDRTRTGELVSRTGTDVQAVRRFMGFGLLSIVRIVVMFLFVLAAGMMLSVPLTLIILAAGPGMYLTVRSFRRQIKPAFKAIHEQNANLSSRLQENVGGIRLVRSFGQEHSEEGKFEHENSGSFRKHLAAATVRARHAPMMDFWGFGSRALLLLAGGWLVIEGHVTIGTFIAFDGYLARIMQPIKESHNLIDMLGESLSSGDRIFQLLDTQPEIASPATAAVPAALSGEVRFDRVSLSYGGAPALRDIDLTVGAGQTAAVIGATGAGKTSLVNLINRAYDPDRGRVLLDGRDVREYSLQDLRRQIAVIPQEAFLFSATIFENIAYGRPDASLEEVEDAARRAQAHDFIAKLPDGYHTVVGERGSGLSGGQKQRLTIARAVLTKPSVLIVDDATSAVDMETEFLIWEALENIMKDCTTFIVAQRLSTIRNVDRIIVLDQGRLVEMGTSEELLERDGLYAHMKRVQDEDARHEVLAPGVTVADGGRPANGQRGGQPAGPDQGDAPLVLSKGDRDGTH